MTSSFFWSCAWEVESMSGQPEGGASLTDEGERAGREVRKV